MRFVLVDRTLTSWYRWDLPERSVACEEQRAKVGPLEWDRKRSPGNRDCSSCCSFSASCTAPPHIFLVQIVTILNAPFHWSPCSQFFLIYFLLANNPIPWHPALSLWHLVFACDVLSPRCSLCLVHDTFCFLCSSCSGVARWPQHGAPSTVSPAQWLVGSCAVQEPPSLALVELNVRQNQRGLLKGTV